MRERKSGPIPQHRGDAHPARYVVWVPDVSTGSVHVSVADHGQGRLVWSEPTVIRSFASWWRWLACRLSRGRQIMAITSDLVRHAADVGWWQQLESGSYYLTEDTPERWDSSDLDEREWWHGYCVIDDPPTIFQCRCRYRCGGARMVDAANWAVYPDMLPSHPRDRLAALCEWWSDWMEVIASLDLGTIESSAVAQGWTGWRHSYMYHPVHVHTCDDALRLERAAIYGGAMISYHWGVPVCDVHELDVRSMHSHVAATSDVPVSLVRYVSPADVGCLRSAIDHYWVVAHVLVRSRVPRYPYRVQHRVIYPIGKWWTVLAGTALHDAVARGDVIDVRSMAVYHAQPALAWFARLCMFAARTLRDTGKAMAAASVKYMVNGLFGRFARKQRRWVNDQSRRGPSPWCTWTVTRSETGEVERWRQLAWHAQREVVSGEAHDSFPAVLASIEATARVRMLDIIDSLPPRSVYRLDADTIWTTPEGAAALAAAGLVGDDPGQLRLVQVHPTVTFVSRRSVIVPRLKPDIGQAVAEERPPRPGRAVPPVAVYGTCWDGAPGHDGWVVPTCVNECPVVHGDGTGDWPPREIRLVD